MAGVTEVSLQRACATSWSTLHSTRSSTSDSQSDLALWKNVIRFSKLGQQAHRPRSSCRSSLRERDSSDVNTRVTSRREITLASSRKDSGLAALRSEVNRRSRTTWQSTAQPGSRARRCRRISVQAWIVEDQGAERKESSSTGEGEQLDGTECAERSQQAGTSDNCEPLLDQAFRNSHFNVLEKWLDANEHADSHDGAIARQALGRGSANSSEAAGVSASGSHAGLKEQLLGRWDKLYKSVTPRVRGLILLNMLTFLYGSNIAVVKEANAVLDPATFAAGRFAIAALVFSPFLARAFRSRVVRDAGLELGVWASIGYLAQAVGLLSTDAGRASFISTFTVIEVPIIAGLFGARIPRLTWISAAAAVCGVGLLETSGGTTSWVGDAWTFGSALLFGVHMLRSEHHSKLLAKDNAAVPLIALQLLVIAVCSTVWSLVSHIQGGDAGLLAQAAAGNWEEVGQGLAAVPLLPMLYTGLASTAFCLWIEVVSLRDVSATEAAMVYTMEPLYGAGFAWLLLGERWGLKGWIGAALILGGSLTMQLFADKHEEELPEVKEEKSPPMTASKSGSRAAAILLLAATLISASAAIMLPAVEPGERAAEQAALLADNIDLDNFAALLRIYVLSIVDSDKDSVGDATQHH
eukprot:jgi/Mesen1/10425/ME000082S09926